MRMADLPLRLMPVMTLMNGLSIKSQSWFKYKSLGIIVMISLGYNRKNNKIYESFYGYNPKIL